MPQVREIAEAVERLAPPSLAEAWDNCGLQVGNPAAEVGRVLVALTPLPEVFEEAEASGADFLLFHHPLIFGGLNAVDTGAYPGNLIHRAIRGDLAVYAAHTSYDAAPNGVSVPLAEILGLAGPLEVVAPRGGLCKLVVFTPKENLDEVAGALAGAGGNGDYAQYTFLPGDAANPYPGGRGRPEGAGGFRLETVVPAYLASRAAAAASAAHPSEEIALDVYPLEGHPEGCGYGRIGDLPRPLLPGELVDHVSAGLGFPARLVSDPEPHHRVGRVAVLGGSGGSFMREVAASRAQAYVTGDLDYHDALLAESLGLVAIDAGHAATELPSLAPLARRLSELVDVPVTASEIRR
ncbi:MAG: Nif3-like dinuclear metal center hexameric protein [Rubrobacteraceae bacterium]